MFLDVETGGLDADRNPVLQIAMGIPKEDKWANLKIQAGGLKVDDAALAVNGLKRDDLESNERLTQAAGAIAVKNWVEENVGGRAEIVAHNAQFDKRFVEAWFGRVGVPFERTFHYLWMDTMGLFLVLRNLGLIFPQSLKLSGLCAYFKIPLIGAHDALVDIRATVELFRLYNEFIKTGDKELLKHGGYEYFQARKNPEEGDRVLEEKATA